MGYNKFITKDRKVLLDLTQDDITPQDVRQGIIFHGRDGVSYTGELRLDLQEKTVSENGEVAADEGYYGLSKVTVNTPEFNIAYGETAPEDATKLWVKTNKPESVTVTTKPILGAQKIESVNATLSMELAYADTAVVGTKIYLFGGMSSVYNTAIQVFDTETNKASTVSISGQPILHKAGVAVGSKMYFFGDYVTANNTIKMYDIANKSLTTLSATLPSKMKLITMAAVGTKIYLFGGRDADNKYLTAIRVFSTEDNSLTTLEATMPVGSGYIPTAVVGSKIYLFGGATTNGRSTMINVFDTNSNTMTTLDAVLPIGADSMGIAALGTKIYLFGGSAQGDTGFMTLSTINVFDTETQILTTLDTKLSQGLTGISCACIGTKVYLFGGDNGANGFFNTIRTFTVSADVIEPHPNTLLLEVSTNKKAVKILPNIELGINKAAIDDTFGNRSKVEAYLSETVNEVTEWTKI